jgi:homoserine O-succinyltransferase
MNALPKIPPLASLRAQSSASRTLVIGLLNNSPESAFRSTERRFARALQLAAPDREIEVRSYALPEISRSFTASLTCLPADNLRTAPPDALIISGAEPACADLRAENFWESLTGTMDWARENRIPMILSCLAAHAAVLHSSGVERIRLARKCAGVFPLTRRMDHRLLAGLGASLCTPHSRWNALPEDGLLRAGYRILTSSVEAGVDMFIDPTDDGVLYLNGHPEYDSGTLIREFCRDAARFIRGERSEYPDLPKMAIDDRTRARLDSSRRLATSGHVDAALELLRGVETDPPASRPWRAMADCVFANWLSRVSEYTF